MRKMAKSVTTYLPDLGGFSNVTIAGPEHLVIQTKIQEVFAACEYSGVKYFRTDNNEEFIPTRNNYPEMKELISNGLLEEKKPKPAGIPADFMLNILPKKLERPKGSKAGMFDENVYYEIYGTEAARVFLAEHCGLNL